MAVPVEKRKEIARQGVEAKKAKAKLVKITHAGVLNLGGLEIPCYITENDERILSGRGMQEALGLVDKEVPPSGEKPGSRLDRFLGSDWIKSLICMDKISDHRNPIQCIYKGKPINGFKAIILADICEAMLEAKDKGLITTPRREIMLKQCEILMRGFFRIGIVALVDEATGYQRDRTKDALAKILETFVAKDLQAYLKTFPVEFYENLFRLRDLPYPPEPLNFRPQYFGCLTNDIVYRRLAPGLLREIKLKRNDDAKKGKLFQRLTPSIGYRKLCDHIAGITALMRISTGYDDFMQKINLLYPIFEMAEIDNDSLN